MHINELDGVMLLLMFVSGMIGILRGLIRELLQLVSLSLATFCGMFFRKNLVFLVGFVESGFIKELIAGVLIFIFMFVLGNITIYLICQTIKTQGFGKFIDKILGLQFGILRGVLFLMLSIMVVENNNTLTSHDWWQNSLLLDKIQHAAASLSKAVPTTWKEKIQQLKE